MITNSFDGRTSSNRSANDRHGQRLPLVALVVATGLAAAMACGTDNPDDDETDTDSNALQPVAPITVAPRVLPDPEPVTMMPAAAAPPPLGEPGAATMNGLSIPTDVEDWRVIGAAAPGGPTGTVRVIIGNRTAVAAARAGNTNPWPEGSMLSHLSWKSTENPDDAATQGPGDFDRLTLMVKNTQLYAADGGWAYGVWLGPDLRPLAASDFDRACVNCHTDMVKDKDYVFTDPGQLPSDTDIARAARSPNGLDVPAEILNWRVIGVANVTGGAQPTIRVIVGNDTAVSAARAGQTNPWPDGTMLSHYNWAAGTNPDAANTVAPGAFNAFTLMVRNSAAYPTSGGWAYGVWPGVNLVPLAAGFDQGCIDCHTDTVKENDYVFTRPGELPGALLDRPIVP